MQVAIVTVRKEVMFPWWPGSWPGCLLLQFSQMFSLHFTDTWQTDTQRKHTSGRVLGEMPHGVSVLTLGGRQVFGWISSSYVSSDIEAFTRLSESHFLVSVREGWTAWMLLVSQHVWSVDYSETNLLESPPPVRDMLSVHFHIVRPGENMERKWWLAEEETVTQA